MPAIPAVVICSETNRHEQLVLPAAAAKKHMFVEKPLGFAAADAWRMARAIEEAGVLFQTGYFMRGNPAHLFLREQIKAGAFGKITRIRHSNCHAGSIGRWFDTDWRWMADLDQAGVGAFGDLGTHSLDILMWLMGDIARTTAAMDVALGNYGPTDEFGEGLHGLCQRRRRHAGRRLGGRRRPDHRPDLRHRRPRLRAQRPGVLQEFTCRRRDRRAAVDRPAGRPGRMRSSCSSTP